VATKELAMHLHVRPLHSVHVFLHLFGSLANDPIADRDADNIPSPGGVKPPGTMTLDRGVRAWSATNSAIDTSRAHFTEVEEMMLNLP
jgi:hypothetical protein